MKINTKEIKGYEEMTAEEKVKALETFELKVSHEGYIEKAQFDKVASELAEEKRKYRETLDDNERLKLEEEEKRKSIEKEIADLKKDKELSDAKAKYIGLGYSEELAEKTATALIDGDMETVFGCQKEYNENLKKDIEKELLDGTRKPKGGNEPKGLTREDIQKMNLIERQKLMDENPEEFIKIYMEG